MREPTEQETAFVRETIDKVFMRKCDNNECDPFNVPEDFWPTTIAIHLGRRI